MKNTKIILGSLSLFFLPFTLRAQLSLDDCQQLAEKNYPLLKKYDLIGQTTQYTVKNIQQGYLPHIAVTGQATVQNDVPTLPGALDQMLTAQGMEVKGLKKDQYRVGVDVDQLIWDGGQIKARKQLAEAEGKVSTAENEVQLYALRSRINELYFGLLWLDERIALSQAYGELLAKSRGRLEALEKGGMVMGADVDAVRAEELKARQQTRSLLSVQRGWRQVLALFVGKEEAALQQLVKPKGAGLRGEVNRRPELQLFDARLQQMDLRTELLNRARYPQISLFARGGYGYPGFDYFEDMFHHDWKWTAMAGLRLRWDISSFYTQKNERRRLSLLAAEIDNAREVFLFNNRLQTTQQRAEWQRYAQLLSEDDEIVRLRQSVRESAEKRLEKGVIDVVQLLQEITKENEARIERSSHEIEMLKAIYELKYTLNN